MSDELLARLAPDNPITWSTEGLDDCCFWCGARSESTGSPDYASYAEHETDCAWMAARAHLGLTTGLNVFRVPWCECGHDEWEHGGEGCADHDCGCGVVVEREPYTGNPFGWSHYFPTINVERGAIQYIRPPLTASGGVCEAPTPLDQIGELGREAVAKYAQAKEAELLAKMRVDDE